MEKFRTQKYSDRNGIQKREELTTDENPYIGQRIKSTYFKSGRKVAVIDEKDALNATEKQVLFYGSNEEEICSSKISAQYDPQEGGYDNYTYNASFSSTSSADGLNPLTSSLIDRIRQSYENQVMHIIHILQSNGLNININSIPKSLDLTISDTTIEVTLDRDQSPLTLSNTIASNTLKNFIHKLLGHDKQYQNLEISNDVHQPSSSRDYLPDFDM